MQKNIWGSTGGDEPQRSDLWFVDLSLAVAGLNAQIQGGNFEILSGTLERIADVLPHQAASVSVPEVRVRSEPIKRDSNPYNTAAADDAPDAARIQFILDAKRGGKTVTPFESNVYKLLTVWRTFVRAGRYPMSTEAAITLNDRYRIDSTFDIPVVMLRGAEPTLLTSSQSITQTLATNKLFAGVEPGNDGSDSISLHDIVGNEIASDLQVSTRLILKKAWISSFKISDISYKSSDIVTLDAQFYIEDVLVLK